MTGTGSSLKAVGFLLLAVLINSLQNIAVKWIGGNYSIFEMLTFRSLVALPLTLLFFRLEGGRGLPFTRQPKREIVRGAFLFLSYATYMMGLVALPLADVESIRFSGPLMITLLSVRLLGEKVELPRWLALVVGFLGVLLIVKPGSTAFNLGSVFILVSIFFYALTVILTRKLQTTDSSPTMAFYGALVYVGAIFIFAPLAAAVGAIPHAAPSLAFLFHAWSVPTPLDLLVMCGLGLVWAGWMYFVTRAYSAAPASVVAPFEYASLPINILWGLVLWHSFPAWSTLAGAALTLLSGLFILYRGQRQGKIEGPEPIKVSG